MVKSIKDLLKEKIYKNSDEEKIVQIMKNNSFLLKRDQISLSNGLLSFRNIPSSLRMNIVMKKKELIEIINGKGLYLRDII